jgi:hypothetical protein
MPPKLGQPDYPGLAVGGGRELTEAVRGRIKGSNGAAPTAVLRALVLFDDLLGDEGFVVGHDRPR